MWPPEIVYLSPNGDKGPTFRRHRDGIVEGHPKKVCMMRVQGNEGRWYFWQVCNRFGSYNTMALAILLNDPFQLDFLSQVY